MTTKISSVLESVGLKDSRKEDEPTTLVDNTKEDKSTTLVDNTLANFSQNNVVGECSSKCSYSFEYSKSSNCVANNTGRLIKLSYDESNVPPVTYNGKKYKVTGVGLMAGSYYLFNGKMPKGLLMVQHEPVVAGESTPDFGVIIPIVSGTSDILSSNILKQIINETANLAPKKGDKSVLSVDNYNLNNFVPKKPFYSFKADKSMEAIAYGIEDAIIIDDATITKLNTIVKPVTDVLPVAWLGKIFYNSKGPNQEDTGIQKLMNVIRQKPDENPEENPDQPEEIQTDWGRIAFDFLKTIIVVLISIVIGARVIFASKVAQFNVMPTNIDCMPYKPTYGESELKSPDFQSYSPVANIDEIRIDSGGSSIPYSTKIKYDITKESMHFGILDYIRKIEYDPNVGSYAKYAMSSFTKIYVLFYGLFNWMFEKLNKLMPEWFLFLTGAIIVQVMLILIIPVGFIGSLIIFLTNYHLLLRRNMNNDPDYEYKDSTKPVWRDVSLFSSIPNFLGSLLFLWFGWITSTVIIFTPIPYIIGLICLLTPFFMSATYVTGPKAGKAYNFFSSLKGVLESKMFWIVLLVAFYLSKAFMVGYTEGYVALPVAISASAASLVFVGVIYYMGSAVPPAATSKIASYNKNLKYCPKPTKTAEDRAAEARDAAFVNRIIPRTDSIQAALPMNNLQSMRAQNPTPAPVTSSAPIPNPNKVPVVPENIESSSTTNTNTPTDTANATQKGGGELERRLRHLRDTITPAKRI